MNSKIKLLLVEDHEMTRMGLQIGIGKSEKLSLIGEAVDGLTAVKMAEQLLPDVILMDIGLPEIDGIEATKRIKNINKDIKILMFTSRESENDVFAALAAGADGYITKGTNLGQLIMAIEAIYSGASWLDPVIAKMVLGRVSQPTSTKNPIEYVKSVGLTQRELEILTLIAEGLSNVEIADKLVISKATAKSHVHSVLQKLSVENRTQATITAVKEGLI